MLCAAAVAAAITVSVSAQSKTAADNALLRFEVASIKPSKSDGPLVLQPPAAPGHPDAAVRVLPGLNHFFQHAETGLPTEIPQIDETFAPFALDAIADWIATRFLRDK